MFRKRKAKKLAQASASSRKTRRKAKKSVDPLGGFSMEQLFGLDPVTETKRNRTKSVAGSILTLPFAIAKLPTMAVANLLRGIVSALVEIIKLPVRVVGAILSPWGSDKS